jgi:hypothetical protein
MRSFIDNKKYKLLYFVRHDFFHHNHIHRRKLSELNNERYDIEIISLVTNSQWEKYKDEYKQSKIKYGTRVIRLPDGKYSEARSKIIIRLLILFNLLRYKSILLQSHLSDLSSIYPLRKYSFWRNRVKILTQYEGDLPAESVYWQTVNLPDGPLEDPDETNKPSYLSLLKFQRDEIENSDGILVESKEHLDLLETRHNKKLNSLIFPTLFDSKKNRFLKEDRYIIRKKLKFQDEIVLVHLGGALNPWHRFANICNLVIELHEINNKIRFLGIIRKSELSHAINLVSEYKIENISTLITLPPDEVPAYLSAADVGIFIRHHHTMTRIVTSAKLGEYIACGLPIISTGAHALYNEFIQNNKISAYINDNLSTTDNFIKDLSNISELGKNNEFRSSISKKFKKYFDEKKYKINYARFCDSLLKSEEK